MSSFTTFLTCFAALSTTGWAQYTLQDDYMADGFFDMFTFWDAADPTDGFVDYVDQATAQQNGYISQSSSSVYIGTDAVNVTDSSGRKSVRITSNKSYDSGLVILDLEHMPGGICGTWPAFWMTGPNWPDEGEIDIIEGVNAQTTNGMTLHTTSGCTITNNGGFSGDMISTDCNAEVNGNEGCSISDTNSDSYGDGFNSGNGGVYATSYESSGISVWFFPRSSIPSDISSGSPDPSGWGTPVAEFQGGCDIDEYITSQNIVFDLTFCGDWAGEVWSDDSTCSALASSCDAYVQNNPSAFKDAYWSINSLKVYQSGSGSASSYSSAPTASATAYSTSAAVSVWSSSTSAPASVWSSSTPVASASSPAETTPASSSATPATSTEAATSSYNWPTHTWTNHRYTPRAEAVEKHLRMHKRHSAGRF